MRQNVVAWGGFAAFVVVALILSWHDDMLRFQGALGVGKAVVWAAFFLFTGYSVRCSSRENIFESIGSMAQLYWGRQVGIDLYLGLFLALAVIYLHEGGIVLLLWAVPVLLFANLATLLYVAIHFESLTSLFLS